MPSRSMPQKTSLSSANLVDVCPLMDTCFLGPNNFVAILHARLVKSLQTLIVEAYQAGRYHSFCWSTFAVSEPGFI